VSSEACPECRVLVAGLRLSKASVLQSLNEAYSGRDPGGDCARGQHVLQVDFFALSLALPQMADDLNQTTTNMQWVLSAYMIAVAATMIPAGRLGDLRGTGDHSHWPSHASGLRGHLARVMMTWWSSPRGRSGSSY
jgi:hypothetical protein